MRENYEALGDEKFQLFCAALIQREYPDLQCFPVGQPDGGRDAIASASMTAAPSIVFQVKFSRDPARIPDPAAWIIEALTGELDKVKELTRRGARKYYLMTNVLGSGHLDVGQIDRVSQFISEAMPLPAQCLWRTDLDIRLANAADLRWEFFELLNAGQLLRELAGRRHHEHAERVRRVLRAYVAASYEAERKVRFRQIDLSDELLDLYIDIPMGWQPQELGRHALQHSFVRAQSLAAELRESTRADRDIPHRYAELGHASFDEAATALVSRQFQNEFPMLVLEGAPGQGKSTVVQYLSQVHRIRLLELADELQRVPQRHQDAIVRIPIRIDLRTFATWLQGKVDPFTPDASGPPLGWHPSLDSFLVAHIRNRAGGQDFTVDDLFVALDDAPILLCLDGLDEVGDIGLRNLVIEESVEGIQRISNASPSCHVIVTSRPAAFAKSPGFSKQRFPHFTLGPISPRLALAYAERWAAAKSLDTIEREHLRNVLDDKLTQPHIHSLAQNAMQLAILLNLVNTFGESLPDARTALYDEYVKLFLNREAEKSTTVKEHRSLLIDLHRFVAWTLHSQSEAKNPEAAITGAELRRLLFAYLDSENQRTDIVDQLFLGMIERVVFLVQRVEGLYEFEVQPLREYFCARHLYDTAPASRVGRPEPESGPDRFDVVARNPYWLNVTRFFAGCYKKGELAGLADALVEFYTDDPWRKTPYPRQLITMLLTDFVFDDVPRISKKVIDVVLADFSVRHVLNSDVGSHRARDVVTLPPRSGCTQLVQHAWALLRSEPAMPADRRRAVCAAILANSRSEARKACWMDSVRQSTRETLPQWYEDGGELEVLHSLSADEIVSLLHADQLALQMQSLLRYGAGDALESDPKLLDAALDVVLDHGVSVPPSYAMSACALESLAGILSGLCIRVAPWMRESSSLAESWHGAFGASRRYASARPRLEREGDRYERLRGTVLGLKGLIERPIVDWEHGLARWSDACKQLLSLGGSERFAALSLAAMASGISSREFRGSVGSFDDPSADLPALSRYARLQSGRPRWWAEQKSLGITRERQVLLLALFFSWATARSLTSVGADFSAAVDTLDEDCFAEVDMLCWRIAARWDRNHLSERVTWDWVTPRAAMLLSHRVGVREGDSAIDRALEHEGVEGFSYALAYRRVLLARSVSPQRTAQVVKEQYSRGIPIPSMLGGRNMERDVAEEILKTPASYPIREVQAAERALFRFTARSVIPVATTARRRRWFAVTGQAPAGR